MIPVNSKRVFRATTHSTGYDGQVVRIVAQTKAFEDGSSLYVVRAPDGCEFTATNSELTELTDTDNQTIKQLRDSGHVVVIWSPEEIGDADPSTLEDIVIQRGNEYLEDVNEE